MSEDERADDIDEFAQTRSYWRVLGYAALLGVVGAFAGLAFLGLTGLGERWFDDSATGWFEGPLWLVAVTSGAGLVIGLLRKRLHMPPRQPGLIDEISAGEVDPRNVPGKVAVSAVSLIGGASLGPEAALGSMGGGIGSWLSARRGESEEVRRANTLNGMAGAYGGMLSSPILGTLLVLEIARLGGRRFVQVLTGGALASAISFAIYFPIAGSLFLQAYSLPDYEYDDWHLLAGAALGAVAGVLALLMGVVVGVTRRLVAPLEQHTVIRPVVGGAVFGLIAVVLPLTLFTGSDQLATVIEDAGDLGVPLLVALVFGKMIAFAVSSNTGFIGGPVFPTLFVGGTAGVAAFEIVPGLPPALAFTCMLAAVPGAVVSAPFTMVLLAGLVVGVGALQLGPILIAVVVAYILVTGTGVLQRLARHSQAGGASEPTGE